MNKNKERKKSLFIPHLQFHPPFVFSEPLDQLTTKVLLRIFLVLTNTYDVALTEGFAMIFLLVDKVQMY